VNCVSDDVESGCCGFGEAYFDFRRVRDQCSFSVYARALDSLCTGQVVGPPSGISPIVYLILGEVVEVDWKSRSER